MAILKGDCMPIGEVDYLLCNYSFYTGIEIFFVHFPYKSHKRVKYNLGPNRIKYINVYSPRGEGSSVYLDDMMYINRHNLEFVGGCMAFNIRGHPCLKYIDPWKSWVTTKFLKLKEIQSNSIDQPCDLYNNRFPVLSKVREYNPRCGNREYTDVELKVVDSNSRKFKSCVSLILCIKKLYLLPREIINSIVHYVIYCSIPNDWLPASKPSNSSNKKVNTRTRKKIRR